MRLLYFNPETEYALASGASFYTPPAVVEEMRRANQLLPERWAKTGDVILVDDVKKLSSDFLLADWSMLEGLFSSYPMIKIEPWGWNKALVRKFLDNGVPMANLPNDATIELIRTLAHRRTTIILNDEWNRRNGMQRSVVVPFELHTEEECIEFMANHPGCWFKAPWSSSGRGVINTSAEMTPEKVRQWCHGIIRRQGSVLAETNANRKEDFATEWILKNRKATYKGISAFKTSNRGKYISNSTLPQSELIASFNECCKIDLGMIVELQKVIIEDVLGAYSGPLGVDMIVDCEGMPRPFVEVNLRMTMGMINIVD